MTVTPNDGYIDGNFGLSSITISNSLPTISSVAIAPSTANNDDVLTCSAVATDADIEDRCLSSRRQTGAAHCLGAAT